MLHATCCRSSPPVACTQSLGPAVEYEPIGVSGPFQQACGAHRTFTVAAHHHGGLIGQVVGSVGDVAEFDIHRSGQMPGQVLGALADVEDPASAEVVGAGERGRRRLS